MSTLKTELPKAFAASQDPLIVPPGVYAGIQDTAHDLHPGGATAPITIPFAYKAIQELFELNYGRMNAILGTELPFTNFNTQTTIPLAYIDPPDRDHLLGRNPDLEDHPQRRRYPSRSTSTCSTCR